MRIFALTLFAVFFPTLEVGEQVFPYLEIWHGEDRRAEQLYVSAQGPDKGALRAHSHSTGSGVHWAAALAAHGENDAQSVGLFAYGEAGPNSDGLAWGANIFATTYSPHAGVSGIEMSGINLSGSPAWVYGGYIVNGGNAPTKAALAIETSWDPQLCKGVPDYAVWLKQDPGREAPARLAGIRIDNVQSGRAIELADNLAIVLSTDRQTYIRYNATTDRIELVRHGVLVGAW